MSRRSAYGWILTAGALLTVVAIPVGVWCSPQLPPRAVGFLTVGMMIGGLAVFLMGMLLAKHHQRVELAKESNTR
jgi:hypothetical protein